MIVLRNASPYRAGHTLAEARSPYGGIKSRSNLKGKGAASVERGIVTLKHVPVVEELDWSICTVKKAAELESGDIIFFSDEFYVFQSLLHKAYVTNGRPTNVLTVLQGSRVKKLWMDAKLDSELIVLKGKNV